MGLDYNSKIPVKVNLKDLTDEQETLLMDDDHSFCMYPWIHLHTYPDSSVHLCCMSAMNKPIGNLKTSSLEEVWNGKEIKDIRKKMLIGEPVSHCMKCKEQEKNGFVSGRVSANKHYAQFIDDATNNTSDDGSVKEFKLRYWDFRFSNQCNLKCRTCGPLFSSKWYNDYVKLHNEDPGHKRLVKCADENDKKFLNEILDQIPYVEQIYFAGGEPLIMPEHWAILEALIDAGKTDISLIYNSNFSKTTYKKHDVFEMWNKFDHVSVGASLDDMGNRGEYTRKETVWKDVEENRKRMMEVCPQVDFYISATLSLLNVFNITNFHKEWSNKGLINPQDFNINILMDPKHYRIDNLPDTEKDTIRKLFEEHIEWLEPLDNLKRATNGFKSAVNFLNQPGDKRQFEKFFKLTRALDKIRDEDISTVLPEYTRYVK
jgi:MoaA/NifB/PqqE/SkfB family radical SAM enzyme